jgi:hypothetical protein
MQNHQQSPQRRSLARPLQVWHISDVGRRAMLRASLAVHSVSYAEGFSGVHAVQPVVGGVGGIGEEHFVEALGGP